MNKKQKYLCAIWAPNGHEVVVTTVTNHNLLIDARKSAVVKSVHAHVEVSLISGANSNQTLSEHGVVQLWLSIMSLLMDAKALKSVHAPEVSRQVMLVPALKMRSGQQTLSYITHVHMCCGKVCMRQGRGEAILSNAYGY